MTKPRLIHLTTTAVSLNWLLRPQLEAFADAGYDVIGVSAGGEHAAALRASGIRHVELPSITRSMAPAQDLKAAIALHRFLRSLRPTIVHTHNPKPGVLGRPIARAAGVPVVINTVHGLYAQPDDRLARRSAVYGAERFAARFSDMELVQNPEDLATLRALGVPDHRLRLLGNGIDLDRFGPTEADRGGRADKRASLGVDPDTVLIGMVGRLVWEKGYAELFEAARLLRDRGARAEVVVIGPHEPDKAGAVDAEAVAGARAHGVTFLGQRDDVEDWYRAMDVFVLPSYREGFPRSAMEAAATGLPVVTSDIRGCRQVVDQGQTGLLVPARDAAALADALQRLVDDADLRSTMGRAAIEKAQADFDDRDVIDLTLDTYDALLGSAG